MVKSKNFKMFSLKYLMNYNWLKKIKIVINTHSLDTRDIIHVLTL